MRDAATAAMAGEKSSSARSKFMDEATPHPPDESGLDAIAPLAVLPVFYRLAGKRAVVAGGSEAAAWKAELLAAAGARVDAYAAAASAKMTDIAKRHAAISIVPRAWTAPDLAGAIIAIGDFKDNAESAAFRAVARAAGAAVNIIDQPEFCDFSFGAIVNRSPLVIAVSTDGASPVFGRALRARIEAIAPQGLAAWAAGAEAWRGIIHRLGLGFRERLNFWERFATLAFANADRAPNDADRNRLVAEARGEAGGGQGELVLIEVKSDAAEWLPLKALRALQSADAIIFDDKVSPDVLDFGRREAQRVKLSGATAPELIATLCASGKKVVRLAGGPADRLQEEIEAARATGARCAIIPGVALSSARTPP
ncbi:MAG TPA: NAD(P)-dependent oxidoreductase [Roseiarcus sp.]|nr:NAD(P)-dependent oxidoreductase [Roseiarcus sp.]